MVSYGFFLSRCLSGYAVTAFPCAKDSGLAAMFAEHAQKKWAGRILLAETGMIGAVMLMTDVRLGGISLGAAFVVFYWYYRMSLDKFGGITGDLAGWFLQICELAVVIAAAAAGKIW